MFFISNNGSSAVCPTEKDSIRNNQMFSTLKSYFTVGYYTGVFPFCPKYDAQEGRWRLKKSKFQKFVVCLLLVWMPWWLATVYCDVGSLVGFIQIEKPTVKSYFLLLRRILLHPKFVILCWIILRRSNCIVEHFNSISGSHIHFPLASISHILRYGKQYQRTARIYTALLAFPVVLLVMNVVRFLYDPAWLLVSGSVSNGYDYAKFSRPGVVSFSPMDIFDPTKVYTSLDIFLIIVLGYMFFLDNWLHLSIEILFLAILPVTFWAAAGNFNAYVNAKLEESKDGDRESEIKVQAEIISAFEELRGFFGSLNSVWSTLNLVWLFDSVLRTMLHLNGYIRSGDGVHITTQAFDLLFWIFSMYISGEVYRRMDNVRTKLDNWIDNFILDHGDTERTVRQMKMIVLKLKDEPIGIGTDGVYKYNYSLIAQVLAFMLTLFTISFESERTDSCNQKEEWPLPADNRSLV